MKINQSVIIFLFTLLFSVSFATAVSAQEKENESCGNSCCDGKTKMMHQEKMDDSTMNHTKMEHSEMDHSMMNQREMNKTAIPTEVIITNSVVKEDVVNLQAWNVVCPVRGEEIDPEAGKVEYQGKIYGFCCGSCVNKFNKDPEKYSKNLSDDGKSFVGTR